MDSLSIWCSVLESILDTSKIRRFFFIGLLLIALPAGAQDIVVPESYAYHAGDNLDWARPEFDDSSWERFRLGTFPFDRWQGIGWTRLVLEVDSSLWNVPLAIIVPKPRGAYEFYLDGALVYRIGKIGATALQEKAHHGYHPPSMVIFRPPGNVAGGKSRHLIAMRYSSFYKTLPVWSGTTVSPWWRIRGYNQVIQESARREKFMRKITYHRMLLTGVSLAFSLMHVLLFAFYSELRANLYFAMISAGFVLVIHFTFLDTFVHDFLSDPADLVWTYRGLPVAVIATTLLAVRLAYSLFYSRPPRVFFVFCVVGLGSAILYWFRPFRGGLYLVPLVLVMFAEILRVLFTSLIQKRKTRLEGGWLVSVGLVPFCLIVAYTLMSTENEGIEWLRILPRWWDFADFPEAFYAALLPLVSMSVFLSRNFAQANTQRAELNRELEIAREVQERLFPQQLLPVPGLDYCGACRPARGIGGDYYDFLLAQDGTLGLAIGDVSGKGIGAALLMASLQASLRSQALRGGANLAELMGQVNRLVHEASGENRFATLFYAQYHPETRCLTYVNAGHNPPFVLRRCNAGSSDEWQVARLEAGGLVVGLLPDFVYEQGSFSMESGDLLVAFTDGISEAMNRAREQWGEKRLLDVVRSCHGLSASDALSRLMQAADKFAAGANQHDDMTLLVVRVI